MVIQKELKFFPVENTNTNKLSSAQIESFNKNGFIFPITIFSRSETAKITTYFETLLDSAKKIGYEDYSINGWHYHCRGIYNLMMNSSILEYVSDLIGPNVLNIMTHLFYKRSQDKRKVSWHQDASYWPLTPTKTITVWLALDDVSAQNGAMKFIPGSHHHGQIPFRASDVGEHNVLNQTVSRPEDWGENAVNVELKAGQISIHSDLLLHGSEPNLSTTDRRGLTLRYMPSDVQCTDSNFGKNRRAFQCLGTNPEKHWSIVSPPVGEAIPLKLETPL